MKTVIEMAREAGFAIDVSTDPNSPPSWWGAGHDDRFKALVEFVRADERNSWPCEMEAMERQVNILNDALNDRQRWFDAMTAQHKGDVQYWQDQTLNARADEREACAKVCEELAEKEWADNERCAAAIRARSET
jgi:hypothetical protein